MKHSKIVAGLIVVVLTIAVVVSMGAADAETFGVAEEEANAVYEGLIGAENVGLALGEYRSDTGTTAQLSEEELQLQIDTFNEQINRYYAVDNPCYDHYKKINEDYLRKAFVDRAFCRLEGGVLDYDVHSLTFDETKTAATVEAIILSYNKWVNQLETNNFEIICCSGTEKVTAQMVKEDGVWKLQRYVETIKLDDWIPQDALYNNTGASTYSLQAEESPEVEKAAELADAEYTSFADALNAAEQINVEEVCPLSVSDYE